MMNKPRGWVFGASGAVLLVLLACGVASAQVNQVERNQAAMKPSPATAKSLTPVQAKLNPALLPAIQIGSEKVASYKTVAGWQYAIGETDVMLPRNGACLVTCDLDVQSHVLTGYLTFRTARRNVTSGADETDSGWAMDVPVPISQGSSSATFTWTMTGGQTYRFGCRSLADRGFLGIDVYPNVSWICR